MTDLDPARIPALEKMARDANAAAIEQWNRADAAEAALAEAQEREQRAYGMGRDDEAAGLPLRDLRGGAA